MSKLKIKRGCNFVKQLVPSQDLGHYPQFRSGAYANAWEQNADGTRTINLGATDFEGKLKKTINDGADNLNNSNGLDFYQNFSMNEVERLLERFDKYNGQADYKDFPNTDANCNTFTNTINEGNFPLSMADTDILLLFPGIDKFLNPKYFE